MASPADSPPSLSPPEGAVDPFLVEALQNPRHRLTILRMELDIQNFINSESVQFEFPYFPSSYIRLAAHRVAQHYGLHSLALDSGTRIVIQKTPDLKHPSVSLLESVSEPSEHGKVEPFRIAIKPKLKRASSSDLSEIGAKRSAERSVEEREEEYEKARARIFKVTSNGGQEGSSPVTNGKKSPPLTGEEGSSCSWIAVDADSNAFRVSTIFKDREQDRSDPDYDRSYDRYIKSRPVYPAYSSSGPLSMLHPSYVPYDASYPQTNQLPITQSPVNYDLNPLSTPFYSHGPSHIGGDYLYMNWPSPSMVYAQSYEHLRHGVYQVPFYQQQPLSFDQLHHP